MNFCSLATIILRQPIRALRIMIYVYRLLNVFVSSSVVFSLMFYFEDWGFDSYMRIKLDDCSDWNLIDVLA